MGSVGSRLVVDLAAMAVTLPLLALVVAVGLREHGRLAEATVAVFGAAFAVTVGAVGGGPAADQIYDVAPTIIFLSTLLVFGHLLDAEGVFDWAAAAMARRAGRSPAQLFRRVFVLAALTTAVLSLDATVVLLTPVIVATVAYRHLPARPYTYACAHLANSASLLMPVSNLTNLLAFAATGLSFLSFTAIMTLPWLAAVGVEFLVLRRIFAANLTGAAPPTTRRPPAPRLALVVLTLTVVGFAVASEIGFAPVWSAAAGALILAVRRLATNTSTVNGIIDAANLPFALFFLGLAVIVRGVAENGLGELIATFLPTGDSLAALLAVAAIATILANLVNNLAATLVLLPAATMIGTPTILAVLIGVNVGSNLSYLGSLANLLWRRVLTPYGQAPTASDFTVVGLLTVPLTLIAATTALWLSARVVV